MTKKSRDARVNRRNQLALERDTKKAMENPVPKNLKKGKSIEEFYHENS